MQIPTGSTIMDTYPNGTIPKAADIKAEKIVYEDTYQHTDEYGLDDVLAVTLGTEW